MHYYLISASERLKKQYPVMEALRKGMPAGSTTHSVDEPKDIQAPFIACGQLWVVERIVPGAIKDGRPFWLIDNGYYYSSGKGNNDTGHYELTYKGLAPILMDDPDYGRFPAEHHLHAWQKDKPDGHVLIALPGETFGRMIGLDMLGWIKDIEQRVRALTDRKIVVRPKSSMNYRPLENDLHNAHVVITHSSNVAIDAIIAGVPCIVEKWNPAAPVSATELTADAIARPIKPERRRWWASLMCQQYTIDEMTRGTAWRFMQQIMEQVDGGSKDHPRWPYT